MSDAGRSRQPLLELSGIRVGYGRIPVLFGVDLVVHEAEFVALLGANGAGKTTTLRAISGLLTPKPGTIEFEGRRISGMPAEKIARMGLVHIPEGRGVFPSLAVEETLRLAGSALPRPRLAEMLDRVFTMFPRLGERRKQPVGTLSGGERQMVALSRALLNEPRLLMIDELSQGLAPAICDRLFEVVGELPKEGIAVLLVEQFVGRALELADRAYVLEKGTVSFAGDAKVLAADEDFVAGSYLGEVATDEPETQTGPAVALREAVQQAPNVVRSGLDPERVPLAAELPATLRRALAEMAEERGVSPEELMIELLAREAQR